MNKSEMKRKRKQRKILLTIIMILFTGIVLTASTYAWFTANQTVTVEQIDVNVAASNGLQISVDGLNWKPYISKSDITGASTTYTSAVNQVPNSMVPVSTVGATDTATGFMKMFKGEILAGDDEVNYANILTATQTVEQNTTEAGDFIAFDMFFQLNEAKQIYLTSNTSVKAKGTSKGIENAARVAFILEGNTANGSDKATIQGMKTPQTPVIWEPNYDTHTEAAVNNAINNYGKNITTTSGVVPYHGVSAPIASSDKQILSSTNASFFAEVTPDITTTSAAGISAEKYEKVFSLQPGITKVRIYMWIEGQDVDCENDASGSDLSYNLQFSILDKA